ncbi:MAG: hypothetical protein ACKOJI_10220, partial [Phycisphaerales bacterium]
GGGGGGAPGAAPSCATAGIAIAMEAARGATSARNEMERFIMVGGSSVGRQSYEPAIPGDGTRRARQA